MTQEDKELLFKDLSARLPYGVKAFAKTHKGNKIGKVITITTKFIDYSSGDAILGELYTDDECFWLDYGLFKPYLRPISGMTEDEKKEYNKTLCVIHGHGLFCTIDSFDYLISRHFDVHDLIPKDLAIEVTEENNPYKKQSYERT